MTQIQIKTNAPNSNSKRQTHQNPSWALGGGVIFARFLQCNSKLAFMCQIQLHIHNTNINMPMCVCVCGYIQHAAGLWLGGHLAPFQIALLMLLVLCVLYAASCRLWIVDQNKGPAPCPLRPPFVNLPGWLWAFVVDLDSFYPLACWPFDVDLDSFYPLACWPFDVDLDSFYHSISVVGSDSLVF